MARTRRAAGALALAVWLVAADSPDDRVVGDGRYAMGSILEITLVGLPEVPARALLDRIYRDVARVEGLASRHDEESALAALNRGARPERLAPDLETLLRHAQRYRVASGGAFDISVGRWVELWIEAAERNRLPEDGERRRVAALVGADAFSIDAGGRLSLAEGARLDLGAIAKGYAIDLQVDRLRSEAPQLEAALLNFGQSSYWALGRPPGTEGWTLLLRRPGEGFAGTVTLRDQALSISASLGHSSEIEGRHYGHVIDPRSGDALYRDAQAVVLAPDATTAEALSTALLVMGPEEGLAWIATLEGCEALWLEAGDERASEGWARAALYAPTGTK